MYYSFVLIHEGAEYTSTPSNIDGIWFSDTKTQFPSYHCFIIHERQETEMKWPKNIIFERKIILFLYIKNERGNTIQKNTVLERWTEGKHVFYDADV